MKNKNVNVITILLVIFILASCESAAKVVPTEAAVSTSAETLIVQVTNTPEQTPTVTPDPQILVTVGSEMIKVTKTVLHSETTTTLDIEPAKVNYIEGLWVYTDPATNTRYIWDDNKKANAWVPEQPPYTEFSNLDGSPVYDKTLTDDNTLSLSALLYEAEHNLIPDSAVEVHDKVNVIYGKYYIGMMRENQFQYPDANDGTKVTLFEKEQKDKQPFAWVGMYRVKGDNNQEIVVLTQVRRNQTPELLNKKIALNFGFDRATYESYLALGDKKINLMQRIIEDNDVEILLVLPSPAEKGTFDPNNFAFGEGMQQANPSVAKLQSQSSFFLFTPAEQQAILKAYDIFNGASNKFSSPDQSFSADLTQLPDEFSQMILYPGLQSWMPLH